MDKTEEEYHSKWMCGNCSKIYHVDDFIHNLKKQKVIPDEVDPAGPNGHGFTSVCDCGYVFHKDKWRRNTKLLLTTPDGIVISFNLSSIFLELDHGWGGVPKYYETMLFKGDTEGVDIESEHCWRFGTKDECIAHHEKIVKQFEALRVTLKPIRVVYNVEIPEDP